jgi:hypothetical protein
MVCDSCTIERVLDDARLYRVDGSEINGTAGTVVTRPVRETRAHPTSTATAPTVAMLRVIEVETR